MKCGIYKITNKLNGKCYIGSSKYIEKRLSDHKTMLLRNQHHSIHFQNTFNKHKLESFTFDVLEECTEKELLIREQFYLDTILKAQDYIMGKSNFFIENGYNIKPISDSNRSFKLSETSIKKMLKTINAEIYMTDMEGNVIRSFPSVKYASKFLGIDKNRIFKSIKDKTHPKDVFYGFIKKANYTSEFKPKKYIPWQKINKEKMNHESLKKEIYVFTVYGTYLKSFNSQNECCLNYNITPANLSKFLKKGFKEKQNSKCPYFFTRNMNDLKIKEILSKHQNLLNTLSNNGKYIMYDVYMKKLGYCNNLNEISLIIGCSLTSIYTVLCKKRKHIKNYVIEYNKEFKI